MTNKMIWKDNFFHLIIVCLAIYGWVFAIPIMYPYIEQELSSNNYFFYLVVLSITVALFFNKYFGNLTDKISSRSILSIGLILNVICWIFLAIGNNIYIITIGFILEGISFSAIAVSRSTYSHDLVCSIKDETYYVKLEAKIRKIVTFLMILVIIVTPYLYEVNSKLPFICNIILGILAVIAVHKNRHINFIEKKKVILKKKTNKILFNIKKINKVRPSLIWLILTEGAMIAICAYVFFAFQIHLLDNNATIMFISQCVILVYINKMLGAYLIEKKVSLKITGSFIFILSIITIISGYVEDHIILMLIMGIHSLLREYSAIYLETSIVKQSPYEMRGRVKSLSEILGNTFLIASMTLAIFIEQWFAGSGLLIFFGILFIFCFITLLTFYFKTRKLEIIDLTTTG